MATVSLPYKLQVWLSKTLRDDLKELARVNGLTLQDLVETVLESAVNDPPVCLHKGIDRRAPMAGAAS